MATEARQRNSNCNFKAFKACVGNASGTRRKRRRLPENLGCGLRIAWADGPEQTGWSRPGWGHWPGRIRLTIALILLTKHIG
eukprot:7625016-Alexandrium_andersonii.AAC.1